MSYIARTLSTDETIKEEIRLHWLNYLPAIFFAILAALCLLIGFVELKEGSFPQTWILTSILLITSLYLFLPSYTKEMVVTNKRVIFKKGIISVHSEELYNAKIEAIEIWQSIMGRIFDYGTICFSGTGISQVYFKDIDNPRETKARIESVIYNQGY